MFYTSKKLKIKKTFTCYVSQIEDKKQELKEMQREHDKKKFSINSSLSQMKKQQENKEDKNEEQEQHFFMSKSELRHQVFTAYFVASAVCHTENKIRHFIS